MKWYLFFLSFALASCSTGPTTPLVAPLPFPKTFKQLAIAYKNLPTHWISKSVEINDPPGGPRDVRRDSTAGSESLTFGNSYYLVDSNFHFSKDTTIVNGLTVINAGPDTISEITLQVTGPPIHSADGVYNGIYNQPGINELFLNLSSVDFTKDSLGRIVVSLSGVSLLRSLKVFHILKENGPEIEHYSLDCVLDDNYSGNAINSGSIIFTFTP